jgi:hypothetical protein
VKIVKGGGHKVGRKVFVSISSLIQEAPQAQKMLKNKSSQN